LKEDPSCRSEGGGSTSKTKTHRRVFENQNVAATRRRKLIWRTGAETWGGIELPGGDVSKLTGKFLWKKKININAPAVGHASDRNRTKKVGSDGEEEDSLLVIHKENFHGE